MPSKSKAQQKLFGIALSVKRGEQSLSDIPAEHRDKVEGIVDSMSEKDIEKMASTKHKGKPDKVEEEIITIPNRLPMIDEYMISHNEIYEAVKSEKELVQELIGTGQEIDWIDNNLMGGEANMSRGFIEEDESKVVDSLRSQKGKNQALFQQIADDIEEEGILYYDYGSTELTQLKKQFKLENYKKKLD